MKKTNKSNERSVEKDNLLNRGVEVNELGGRQSVIDGRYDLVDSTALHRLGRALKRGAKKRGEQNWRLIARRDHLNHALFHIYNILERLDAGHGVGDEEIEENLDRAFCRAMMAIGSKH